MGACVAPAASAVVVNASGISRTEQSRTEVAPDNRKLTKRLGKGTVEQVQMNEKIEIELKRWKDEDKSEIKMLLLGAGESGKSTMLKQMRLLHLKSNESEFDKYSDIIYANIITSMGNMLQAMRNLSIAFENPEREVDRNVIFDIIQNSKQFEPLSLEVAQAVDNLWKDSGVKGCYERRNEFQLNDSAKHFFDNINRIIAPEYRPTIEDVLCARMQTTGVVEIKFSAKDTIFRVIDVGGQRSERRKWMHCFNCVEAVIFVGAINEFNQTMREDSETNRLLDSISLFKEVCNNEFLQKAGIILFTNKIDLFQEKIEKGHSIKQLFPDYKGKDNYSESSEYITEKFLEGKSKDDPRDFFVHETCAVDCKQVQKVLLSVEDVIFDKSMELY